MKNEKLSLQDCFKYPNARINDYTSSKDSPNEHGNIFKYIYSCAEFDGANIQFTNQTDFNDYYISNCKLILRPLSSLTVDEEIKAMEFVVKSTMVRHLNLPQHEQKKFDYLRSISIDIDNFIECGKAIAE
jgi:hypothetical protein